MNENAPKQEANFADLVVALHKGRVLVKFTKKDSTITERMFTLNAGLIAEAGYKYKTEEGAAKRVANPNVLNVFQVGDTGAAGAWKSLVRANLLSFKMVEPTPAAPPAASSAQ